MVVIGSTESDESDMDRKIPLRSSKSKYHNYFWGVGWLQDVAGPLAPYSLNQQSCQQHRTGLTGEVGTPTMSEQMPCYSHCLAILWPPHTHVQASLEHDKKPIVSIL
jgi:hypothetical protein